MGQQQGSWICIYCERINNKDRRACKDCKCRTLPDYYERDTRCLPLKENQSVWTYMDEHEPAPHTLGCNRDPAEPGEDKILCQVFVPGEALPAGQTSPVAQTQLGTWVQAFIKGKLPSGEWRVAGEKLGDWRYVSPAQLRWKPDKAMSHEPQGEDTASET